jgi:hypothetical protein
MKPETPDDKTMNEPHVKSQRNSGCKMYFFRKAGTKLAAI